MCGWIALRYLDDPVTAARISPKSTAARPIPSCWRGPITGAGAPPKPSRDRCDARKLSSGCALSTAYLRTARARQAWAMTRLNCGAPSPLLAADGAPATDERVRAAGYALRNRERDIVLYFVRSWEQSFDVAALEALGELTGRRNDAPAMLQLGKSRYPRAGARTITRSRPSEFRGTARSAPKSSVASSIRWREPRARSTSATSLRPTRSADAVTGSRTRYRQRFGRRLVALVERALGSRHRIDDATLDFGADRAVPRNSDGRERVMVERQPR